MLHETELNYGENKRGTSRCYVYTYPSRKAITAVMGKVKTTCRKMATNQPLDALLAQLNRMLPGWCAYFRPGVSAATFQYLGHYTWSRVIRWLRRITPRDHVEGPPPPLLRRRLVASRGGTDAVRSRKGAHHALPLPGSSHPATLANHGVRTITDN